MANKNQNKIEYVKPHSLSLRPSDYQRYKAHAERQCLNFSEMIRVFFEEDIEDEENAITTKDKLLRDKIRAKRLLRISRDDY